MENELRKEGARPPAYREDEAGCSQQSIWVSRGETQAAWGIFRGDKNHLGKVEGRWKAGENEKPGSDPQYTTYSSCGLWGVTSPLGTSVFPSINGASNLIHLREHTKRS